MHVPVHGRVMVRGGGRGQWRGWVACWLKVREVQLSGLAAEDARNPQIMMAGFVLLGAGTVVFGAGLCRVTAPRSAGPCLVLLAGVASVAAGLSRHDHMLLTGPGLAGESWHNQVHDVVSGAAYGAMLAAPLVLARRWRDDPDWAPVSCPVQILALASALAPVVFASGLPGHTAAWCSGSRSRFRWPPRFLSPGGCSPCR